MASLEYDPSRNALYSPERRDTLFECDRPYSELQLAVEFSRLAYVRAEQSPLELERLRASIARVGFADLVLFNNPATGSQAFGARRKSDQVTVVAFRGTQPESKRDLESDLNARLVPWPESGGRVHAGFARAMRSLVAQIEPWIRLESTDRLILTGHSLGAALATLSASIWPSALLATLGSPRVGDADFIATLKFSESVRLVDCCDIVTELPPAIGGYIHIEKFSYIDSRAERLDSPNLALLRADRAQAKRQYLARYAWRFWRNVLTRRLADHAPVNYARAFF